MKSIRMYNHHQHWVTIFGVEKVIIDSLMDKYNDTGLAKRNINLEVLVDAVIEDYGNEKYRI